MQEGNNELGEKVPGEKMDLFVKNLIGEIFLIGSISEEEQIEFKVD